VGSHEVRAPADEAEGRRATRAVLRDLAAMEQMLAEGLFTAGPIHIGAEQEVFLIDAACRPATVAPEVLERLDGPFTTELATYNLETNLDPVPLDAHALQRMHTMLSDAVTSVRTAARALGCEVLLAGILPTLEEAHVDPAHMSPGDRYQGMNDALARWRGEPFTVVVRGLDDLVTSAESVMLESCNTSFQLHLQVDPADFARSYNRMQAITGPVLAAAVNAPVLYGRRLWQETRIALFEQSVDSRTPAERRRGLRNRVGFGARWVDGLPTDLLREDVARYRTILVRDLDEDPLAALERGDLPSLGALALHNGTVWRWNRPCFGVAGGVAHLRIENRVLPAGPTVVDAVANAALFYGLMQGLADLGDELTERLRFEDAHSNFLMAAQHGLDGSMTWLDGRQTTCRALLDELLPVAEAGLRSVGIDDAARWLAPIEGRVRTGQTGARWCLASLDRLSDRPARAQQQGLTAQMLRRQLSGEPVHTWSIAERGVPVHAPTEVRDIMRTDVYTVRPDAPVQMAAAVMRWRHVRTVPVEDDDGKLLGVVSQRALLGASPSDPVQDWMQPAEPRVRSADVLREVARRLLDAGAHTAMVTDGDVLLGVVGESDLLHALS